MIKNYSNKTLSATSSNQPSMTSIEFLLNFSKAMETVKLKKNRILICKN